jgi:hypothetical protein
VSTPTMLVTAETVMSEASCGGGCGVREDHGCVEKMKVM